MGKKALELGEDAKSIRTMDLDEVEEDHRWAETFPPWLRVVYEPPMSPDVEVSLRVYEIADDAEESVLRSDGVALAFSSDIGGVAMRRIALNESKRHLLVPWVISSAESTSVRLEAWSSTEVRRVR